MVSAATTAAMDLTQVTPVLLNGVSQEVGVEPSELKLALVGDEINLTPDPSSN